MRKRIALALAGTVFALLVCELALRLFDVSFAMPPAWRFHPVLGWTQVPGQVSQYLVNGRPVRVSFNRAGFRDVEHQVAKSPEVRRVLIVGDSYCEALQVNLEETFHKRLEAWLGEKTGKKWESINIGVGDFGTAQEIIALERYGLAYQPDLIVAAFFPLNDVCNNSIELYDRCQSPNDLLRPYFVSDERGGLRRTTRTPVRTWLRTWLRTFALVEHRLARPEPRRSYEQFVQGWVALGAPNHLLEFYAPPGLRGTIVERAWAFTDRLLDELVRVADIEHHKLLIAVMPFEGAVSGKQLPPGYRADVPDERLRERFEPRGIPVVPITAELARDPERYLPFIDGHPNAQTHARIAELIEDRLVKLGWLAQW